MHAAMFGSVSHVIGTFAETANFSTLCDTKGLRHRKAQGHFLSLLLSEVPCAARPALCLKTGCRLAEPELDKSAGWQARVIQSRGNISQRPGVARAAPQPRPAPAAFCVALQGPIQGMQSGWPNCVALACTGHGMLASLRAASFGRWVPTYGCQGHRRIHALNLAAMTLCQIGGSCGNTRSESNTSIHLLRWR